MEVKISFDTEKDSVDDLKKLVAGLQDIINRREGNQPKPLNANNQQYSPSLQRPIQSSSQSSDSQQANAQQKKTSGGCRVIPYEDMSDKMSQIFSGRRNF